MSPEELEKDRPNRPYTISRTLLAGYVLSVAVELVPPNAVGYHSLPDLSRPMLYRCSQFHA